MRARRDLRGYFIFQKLEIWGDQELAPGRRV